MTESIETIQLDERLNTETITPELIDYIVQKIVREVDPQKIILFGSQARGDARADSDLDLFVVQDKHPSNRQLRRRIDGLLWGRLFGVDLIVRTPEEVAMNFADHNPFYTHHIFKEGRVLYERPKPSTS